MSNLAPLIIDNGSGSCKIGFAGEDDPRVNIPTRTTNEDGTPGPIDRGIITDWDAMEEIWSQGFNKGMKVSPEEHKVLLTDVTLNPKENKEKMAQIMFEKFNVDATFVCEQGVLSLYSSGRTTGVVLDCGDGVCQVVAAYEGYGVSEGMARMDMGGRDLTKYLEGMLRDKGYSIEERDAVRDAKEKLCYIALDYREKTESLDKSYCLPDNSVITLGQERIKCPESLFQPNFVGLEKPGVHQMLHDCIMNCDVDIRRDLWGNVILCGGSSMFTGFENRLQKELTSMLPSSRKVSVIAAPERKWSVWIGGSILASLSTFQELWVTKKEYDELGSSAIHRKF